MKLNEQATPEQYEAMRLINLFGSKADLVVDEIKKYDKADCYFWDCVKHEINKPIMVTDEKSLNNELYKRILKR